MYYISPFTRKVVAQNTGSYVYLQKERDELLTDVEVTADWKVKGCQPIILKVILNEYLHHEHH